MRYRLRDIWMRKLQLKVLREACEVVIHAFQVHELSIMEG